MNFMSFMVKNLFWLVSAAGGIAFKDRHGNDGKVFGLQLCEQIFRDALHRGVSRKDIIEQYVIRHNLMESEFEVAEIHDHPQFIQLPALKLGFHLIGMPMNIRTFPVIPGNVMRRVKMLFYN